MPYLTPADLSSHIYEENMAQIVRDRTDLAPEAIDTAVDQASAYLGRYDLVALFGQGATAPTVESPYLKKLVKSLACWELLTLANPNIDLALFRTIYEDAVAELKKIQKGESAPAWPYRDTSTDSAPPDGTAVSWRSNPKRTNHF